MSDMKARLTAIALATALAVPVAMVKSGIAHASSSRTDINRHAEEALEVLFKTNPVAADIAKQSHAVLVFPNIVKAGLIFGGAYGEGELKQGPSVVNYYNSFTASWGLQAGAQSYG